MRTVRRAPHAARRGGFTLIELLVVIFLIAILMSLLAGAVIYVMSTSQSRANEANLKKLDTGLMQQWKAVVDQAEEEWRSGSLQGYTRANILALPLINGDPTKGQQAWVAARFAQEFPQNYKEVWSPTATTIVLQPKSAYQKALGGTQLNPGPEEGGTILLVTLSEGRRGMVFKVEEAVGTTSIRTNYATDKNGKSVTVKTLVDIYGTPLSFVRSGTPGSPEIISAGPDKIPGNGDDVSSARLRPTGQRGD
jgi:prepilin-type N-terminal cleavage/methylation domain-containing protein